MNPVVSYCMEQMAAKKHKPLYPDPDPRWTAPMHFWALEDGSTVSFIKTGSPPARVNLISWDGDTWEVWDGSALTLDLGSVLYVKCQTDAGVYTNTSTYWHFDCTGSVCVGGQLRSLVEADNYWDKTRQNTRNFTRLFYQNHALTGAETLKFTQDAITIGNDKYNSMFYECINLRRGPDITAKACIGTTMCSDMFRMCVSLDKPPVIWTQTIGSQAFANMFYLSGIRRAPNLLPTHYPYRACYYMFYQCINLETLPRMRVRSLNATGTIGGEFYYMFRYDRSLQTLDASKYIDIDLDRGNSDTFNAMFANTNIVKAPQMSVHVQAESTVRNGIFNSMFYYAIQLEDASSVEIDADEIYNSQFNYTFAYCTHLSKPPRITAKTSDATLVRSIAVSTTFQQCVSLEDASTISIIAESTNDIRFTNMFNACRSLRKAPLMDITLSGTQVSTFGGFMNGCAVLEDASSIHIKSTVLGVSMFENMLNSCFNLRKAPSFDIQGNVATRCYAGMFSGCYKLTDFPALPFEGAAQDSCCNAMFAYCYSMEEPPNIDFNIVGTHTSFCNSMFRDCYSLRRLPDKLFSATSNTYASAWLSIAYNDFNLDEVTEIMLRTNTGTNALASAFYNCYNLSRIKTHQKDWTGCTSWVSGVRTTLTEIYQPLPAGGGRKRIFICPSDAPQTRGNSAIPANWELETFDEP